MPEAPKLHFNPFTEEALILGFEIQMCLVLIKACVLFFQFPHIGLTQKMPESITSTMLKESHSPRLSRQVEEKLPPIYKLREKVGPGRLPRAPVALQGGGTAWRELLTRSPWIPTFWQHPHFITGHHGSSNTL